MIALDTNILVYAHRPRAAEHARAKEVLERVANGPAAWALPWPVCHEFVGVMSRTREQATPLGPALAAIEKLIGTPGCRLLSETAGHWPRLTSLALAGDARGPRIHDARIAAICLSNGVDVLWSADRDFGRFPEMRVVNPLVG